VVHHRRLAESAILEKVLLQDIASGNQDLLLQDRAVVNKVLLLPLEDRLLVNQVLLLLEDRPMN
jgi:hypothetical protein